MPTPEELRNWYANFKKEVYEKAQIDMDRVEDIGRVKMFYITKWGYDNLTEPEGDFSYACIPHQELNYDNPPPSVADREEYMKWVMDNLQKPETDEQIKKLYEKSREGTLMIFAPGTSESNMQQVYTDENGKITTSFQMSSMVPDGTEDVDEKYHLPSPPAHAPDPDPTAYGLLPFPKLPQPPENMNPSFLSMLVYKIFGMDNDYAKLVRYQEEMASFQERKEAWLNGVSAESENGKAYLQAVKDREEYVKQADKFLESPMGLASVIDNGLRTYRRNQMMEDEELEGNSTPLKSFMEREKTFMMEQHSKLPQGKILKHLEDATEKVNCADRTKRVIREMLGNEASPGELYEWVERGVFSKQEYNPHHYDLPKLENHRSRPAEERKAHNRKFANLAEVAGFAALSHPDVTGDPPLPGLTAEETSRQNYSAVLKNVITVGVPNSSQYLPFLENARVVAQRAVEAYGNGVVQPMADLLRNSIRQTNREVAAMQLLDTEQGINTLYTINRMWNTIQNTELKEVIGLTPEEIKETQANIALYQTITKALDAKQALLEHALYKREMSQEEIKQAGCDIMLQEYVCKEIMYEHGEKTKQIQESTEFQNESNEVRREQMLADRPGHAISQKLLDENWVQDMKQSIRNDCNLDALVSMKREDLGALFGSRTAFANAVAPVNEKPGEPAPELQAPVKENNPIALG